MKRFWITIAIALPLIPAFWVMVLHFNPLCGEELIAEKTSPDGLYVATLMSRNCGAATPYVSHLNLRSTKSKFHPAFLDGVIQQPRGLHKFEVQQRPFLLVEAAQTFDRISGPTGPKLA